MTKTVRIESDIYAELFGSYDVNAREIEKAYNVRLMQIAGGVQIIGGQQQILGAARLLESMITLLNSGYPIDKDAVLRFIELEQIGRGKEILELAGSASVTANGKRVKCLTAGQRDYMEAIEKHTLTFAIGPAGTGKTYLAVAAAVAAFRSGKASRIILTRPAMEAGERLGFLPGDLKEKIDPYLMPLYDALKDMFGAVYCSKLVERGVIEVAPLAYMRGRTLSGAFVILDEAQNTTRGQMKMFLTRIGSGCKMVVTGDITQIDLPDKSQSGLRQAVNLLENVEDVAVCRLADSDIVRHGLVRRILAAYDEGENADSAALADTAENGKSRRREG